MDQRKPSSLELPRARSATVGSGKSAKSEEFGAKSGSSKGSITSSLKAFASNFMRTKQPPETRPGEIPIAREQTPPPVQGPGPHTVRLIPSPGPNILPRSRSAADLLEGVPLAQIDLAEPDKNLSEESRVSFGFASAGYEESMEASFVFGSPRHSVSNTQFGDAAAAVLREMNARMGASNAVSLDQLQGVMANAGKPAPPAKVDRKSDVRFNTRHDREFAKMDSIANHYSVRSKKRKSEHATAPAATPDALFTLPPHLSRSSSTDPEPSAKRVRLSTADGKDKVLKDSPAVRAQLDKRRRSSARKSGASGAAPARPGFGIMKMVKSIWGGGPKPKPTEKPESKPTEPVKRFPSVPTEDPVTLANLPAAPKTRVVSAKKSVGPTVASKGEGSESTRTRSASSLLAPTASSLARQGTVKSTCSAVSKAGPVKPKPTGDTKPAPTKPARTLPVPPTTVARATTTTAQGSARMASPPVRAATTRGATSPGRKSVASSTTKSSIAQPARKSVAGPVRSPSGAARKSIFGAPLTVDAMTMRGSAPTVQPFRLSPQGNATVTKRNGPTDTKTKGEAPPRPQRRPRISRSKVIARLGEKRAAVASPTSKPVSPASKARSSAHVRRSLGAVAARRALDADMDLKARLRKSEAARRRSRVADGIAGRRSEGAVLRR